MHQTFFFIPYEVFGIPIFGFGILMVLWLLFMAAGACVYWKYAKQRSVSELLQTLGLAFFAGLVLCWFIPRIGCEAGIPIRAYGTMMLLGIVTSIALAMYRAPKFGFTREHIMEIAFWLCIPGIIGARLFYVIEYWETFQAPTLRETILGILNIPAGGLVVYGSIIGGFLGGTVYLTLKKLSIPRMMDLLAPSMMLGLALGRLGCFFNGCCFGGICDPAHEHWGVHFPAGSPPFVRQMDEKLLSLDPDDFYYGMRLAGDRTQTAPAPTFIVEIQPGGFAEKQGLEVGDYILSINGSENLQRWQVIDALIWGTRTYGKITMEIDRMNETVTKSWVTTRSAGPVSKPVYPTQLYSSANAFLILLILLVYSKFRANPNGPGMRRDGETFLMFLTLYPISRFILEIIRTDEASAFGTGMSISQNVSLVLLGIAVFLWIMLLRKKETEPANS